jgi:hypothetical protein
MKKILVIKIFSSPSILFFGCFFFSWRRKFTARKKKESKFNENMRRDTGRRKISGNESSEKERLPATG